MKNAIYTALKGMAMGIAEVIPGVSGGTIAFITGIYEKLIDTIKAFGPELFSALRQGGLKQGWKAINGNFLLALIIGMAIGIVGGVFGVVHLLENYPILLWSFFFGLIIASAIYIGRQVGKWGAAEIIGLVAGIAIAYFITVASPAEGNRALWFVFISGSIAISALILPGISGSFMLLLMGMYTYIIPTVKDTLKTLNPDGLGVLIVFALGCAVGLFIFSRILSLLLHRYHQPTMAVLTGFMIGSLNKIWPWRVPVSGLTEDGTMVQWEKGIELDKIIEEVNLWPSTYAERMGDPSTLYAILLMFIGFVLVFGIDYLSKK
jgi:putative membrane protein